MERRLYFLFGDIVSNTGVGALVGLVVVLSVREGWPPLLAMVSGMLLGDVVALPAIVLLSILFGAMEVMVPVMLTGMVTGMLVAMLMAMRGLSAGAAVAIGMLVGLLTLGATYIVNARVQRQGVMRYPDRN